MPPRASTPRSCPCAPSVCRVRVSPAETTVALERFPARSSRATSLRTASIAGAGERLGREHPVERPARVEQRHPAAELAGELGERRGQAVGAERGERDRALGRAAPRCRRA